MGRVYQIMEPVLHDRDPPGPSECYAAIGDEIRPSLFDLSTSVTGFFANDPLQPLDGLQASLLIELEKLDWGSILDNKGDSHAR